MVNLGTIFWSVQVANAADAAAKAEDMQHQFGQTAEKANRANEAVNKGNRRMGKFSQETGKARGEASRFNGTLGLLSTGLFFVASSLGSVILQTTGLSGAWASASGAASTLYGWLASLGGYLPSLSAAWASITGKVTAFASWLASGSAAALSTAAALGVLIGTIGVAAMEVLGINRTLTRLGDTVGSRLPANLRDLGLMLGTFMVGPLAVAGAAIVGFVRGTLRGGLVEGARTSFRLVLKTVQTFVGAWARQWERTKQSVRRWLSFLRSTRSRIRSIFAGMGAALAQELRSAFNAAIPNRVQIPSVTVGGGSVLGRDIPSITVGGGSLNLPQLRSGGMIEQGGMAMLHSGEAVLPAEVTRDITQVTEGAQGGGGGVEIGQVTVEIGDQSLDISRLTPSQVRRLAEELAPELGREVEKIISA